MKRSLLLAAMMALAAATYGCDGGDGGSTQVSEVPDEEALAARVDDWSITREFLQESINAMSEAQKLNYDTDEGRALMAGQMLEEELFHQEALREDVAEDPWVKAQLDDATRRILIQGYYRNFVASEAEPSEQEIHDYYESHQDDYMTLEARRAQHIFSKDRETLEGIKARIVTGGEKFTTMAHKYSEDKITQAEGGDLGFFNPGGYIRGIGFSKAFSDTVFTLERGVVHGPIKWEKGYSLVSITESRPARLKPYDEVHDEIREALTRERLNAARVKVVQRILDTGRYDVRNYMDEHYMSVQRSPEELWAVAQNATDPRERIMAFQEIVDKFPEDEHAAQALFMVGFVYAEELLDPVTANRTLSEVVDRYPDSEYADMARWMIDNMGTGGTPKFEDIDDVNRQMKEDS